MACGKPTFFVDGDPVQEMAEGFETSSTQTRDLGEAIGESYGMVAKPTSYAVKTIQRASVAMGIDPCKHKNAATDKIVLKVMTVAMLMHS